MSQSHGRGGREEGGGRSRRRRGGEGSEGSGRILALDLSESRSGRRATIKARTAGAVLAGTFGALRALELYWRHVC